MSFVSLLIKRPAASVTTPFFGSVTNNWVLRIVMTLVVSYRKFMHGACIKWNPVDTATIRRKKMAALTGWPY